MTQLLPLQLPQKVTASLLAVLGDLLSHPDGTHGRGIARRLRRGYGGTVHAILYKLESARWATAEWRANPDPRFPDQRIYTLSALGRESATLLLAANPDPALPPS